MELNESNYYSSEMNNKYCSVSQYKNFIGTGFQSGCEARALAEINGEYTKESTTALLVGSYVDTALTEASNLAKFMDEHPEMYSSRGSTKGQLKSEFKRADDMVNRVRQDKGFMAYMTGEHQTIMKANLFGLDFKIKMDTYRPGKFISDLKTVEGIHKTYYSGLHHRYVSFIEYFDYLLQGAIYQEVVFKNTGERLPFYLCCVSKEPVTDFEVIHIDNGTLHDIIYGNEFGGGIADNCRQIKLLKDHEVEPCKCGFCDYCRTNKVLKNVVDWRALVDEV